MSLRESLVVNEEEYEENSISAGKRYPVWEEKRNKQRREKVRALKFNLIAFITKTRQVQDGVEKSKNRRNYLAITSMVFATRIGCGGSFFRTTPPPAAAAAPPRGTKHV